MPETVHDDLSRFDAARTGQAARQEKPHANFERLRPSIERCASYAFRHLPRHRRQDNISDVLANAFVPLRRLIERGLEALISPTALAQFAIRRVRPGRELAVRPNATDVLSPYAQSEKGWVVERLAVAQRSGYWHKRLIEDRRATPDELVACTLDSALGWKDFVRTSAALRCAWPKATQHAKRPTIFA